MHAAEATESFCASHPPALASLLCLQPYHGLSWLIMGCSRSCLMAYVMACPPLLCSSVHLIVMCLTNRKTTLLSASGAGAVLPMPRNFRTGFPTY